MNKSMNVGHSGKKNVDSEVNNNFYKDMDKNMNNKN